MFSENATTMANSVNFEVLSLEQQKECISIITETSARAARDAIASADPEDNELKLMRLNSISQSIATGDARLAAALIRHSTFSSALLDVVESKPVLKDPQAFEEVFAEAKRVHINRKRQEILNDFPTNQNVSLKKVQT